MKWDKIVDESRPKVRLVDISLVFTYETNLVNERGQDAWGGCVGTDPCEQWCLTVEEQEELKRMVPDLVEEAEFAAMKEYEKGLETMNQVYGEYLWRWDQITAKRKATMAAKGKTHGKKVG
jgi:hypothetical protein